MTQMSKRTFTSALFSALNLLSEIADKERSNASKETEEIIEKDNKDDQKKETKPDIVKILGYDLVNRSDENRKKPITIAEAYPTFNANGECFYLLMRNTFADYALLKPMNNCLPVKILEEYDRFLLAEVRPHMSTSGFVSETYKLCINKHDFFVGKVLLVKDLPSDKS